jgi:DNA-binding CsgD family transcriptional regulator
MPAGFHLCALYSGPVERDRAWFAFLLRALREGDRLLCLVDSLKAARVPERAARLVEAEEAEESRRLDVCHASDVCVREGRFSADRTTSFLVNRADQATEGGFPLLRVMVDMGWFLRQPEAVDGLLAYESAVNAVVEQASAEVMCMYDLHTFGVEMLVQVLRTHESVLLDGTVLINPHNLVVSVTEPGQAQPRPEGGEGSGGEDRREQATAGDPWHDLTDAELRIVAHVVDGLTNREIATLLVVSRHTVDAHLKHIYIKLGIHTRVELTVLALQRPAGG